MICLIRPSCTRQAATHKGRTAPPPPRAIGRPFRKGAAPGAFLRLPRAYGVRCKSCHGRDSSVGRVSDQRSEGSQRDPGSRHLSHPPPPRGLASVAGTCVCWPRCLRVEGLCLLAPLPAHRMTRAAIWGRASAQARGGGGVSRPGDTLGHPKQARGSSGPPQARPDQGPGGAFRARRSRSHKTAACWIAWFHEEITHERRPSSEGGGSCPER